MKQALLGEREKRELLSMSKEETKHKVLRFPIKKIKKDNEENRKMKSLVPLFVFPSCGRPDQDLCMNHLGVMDMPRKATL